VQKADEFMKAKFLFFLLTFCLFQNANSLNIEINPETNSIVPMFISECEPVARDAILTFAESQSLEVNINTFRVTAVDRIIDKVKVQWTVDVNNGTCGLPDVIIQFTTIKPLSEPCFLEW